MTPIAVFVSGNGTNCEALIRHFGTSSRAKVALVVSSSPSAYALVRAERLGVPTAVLTKSGLNDPDVLLPLLAEYHVEWIVLAGFLKVVPDFLLEAYPRRVVNLHPALLPKFGGKGMYGHHVHEAVKAAGESVTGMTVHYVTSEVDGGEIIAQFSVPISPADTPEDIAEKEHVLEMEHFPSVIEGLIEGKIK
ncbi:MAG: phosphoribosylglycinamide formyltransferase [Bacteroidales bacterium]|nr:phosphoribosylglycinamide formyltransferase [Bacteroidales bacterium]